MAKITITLEDKRDGIEVKMEPHPEKLRNRLKLDPGSETTSEFIFSRIIGTISKIIREKKEFDNKSSIIAPGFGRH